LDYFLGEPKGQAIHDCAVAPVLRLQVYKATLHGLDCFLQGDWIFL